MSRRARNRPQQGRRAERAGIRRNYDFDLSALRAPAIAPAPRAHLRNAPRPVPRCPLRSARRKRKVLARLLALLEDLDLAMSRGNPGGAGSSEISGIGVRSIQSSSSSSAKSADSLRKKSTAVALCEIALPAMVGAAFGVTGPMGSSSVPPRSGRSPMPYVKRADLRLITELSPASKKSSVVVVVVVFVYGRPRPHHPSPSVMNRYRQDQT